MLLICSAALNTREQDMLLTGSAARNTRVQYKDIRKYTFLLTFGTTAALKE